jgi:glycosyltransferase involved in cell wall biosynthesis
MRIGFISTRLAGVDGVSFEVAKWTLVLRQMGHETVMAAGELRKQRPDARLIPGLHFEDPEPAAVTAAAFDATSDPDAVRAEINRLASEHVPPIERWLDDERIDLLIVENAWAIPMQLPLGVALTRVVREAGIPTIGHHHDYFWERARFATCIVPDVLGEAFPPDLPSVRHVSINSLAAGELRERRGLDSAVIPNVFEFDDPPPGRDDYSRALRSELGMGTHNLLVVQPTRVVPRKGIELAIELVARLGDPRAHLLVTSPAGDEGYEYLAQLHMLADRLGVDLRYAADRFAAARLHHGPRRIFSLGDSYIEADLVTFPSLYEGFGNALIETVYFKRPLFVNRYAVYDADIRPLGFRFIEVDGAVTEDAVEDARAVLADPKRRAEDAEHNFEIGRRHLSYGALEQMLHAVIRSFG